MKINYTLREYFFIYFAKIIYFLIRLCGWQGSTLPGALIYKLDNNALSLFSKNKKLILISGTNGKTTTTMLITKILRDQGLNVASNPSGANLKNGILTSLLINYKAEIFALEVDEAVLPAVAAQMEEVSTFVLTNIYRDQLDRYGELNQVHDFFVQALSTVKNQSLCIINIDDPMLYNISRQESLKNINFVLLGIDDEKQLRDRLNHSNNHMYSFLCPNCNHLLTYKNNYIAHTGIYTCDLCDFKRPLPYYKFSFNHNNVLSIIKDYSSFVSNKDEFIKHSYNFEQYNFELKLSGLYNAYNSCMALTTAQSFMNKCCNIQRSLASLAESFINVSTSFGRLERCILNGTENKKVCFILAKNPSGYEENLKLLSEFNDIGALIYALNSQGEDGKDVSWIWDINLENLCKESDFANLHYDRVLCLGERAYDLVLRYSYVYPQAIKWYQQELKPQSKEFFRDIKAPVASLVSSMPPNSCLYIIANYSFILDIRTFMAKTYGFSHLWY